MVLSTIIFFLGMSPAMIVLSRTVQGASTTFTWVTGLAFLAARVDESDLGAYVGWTTVGVAVGEIVGPLVGGPVYDHFGHWAAFGVVEALLLVDILLRGLVRQKKPGIEGLEQRAVQDAVEERCTENDALLEREDAAMSDYAAVTKDANGKASPRAVACGLAQDWMGTVFMLIVIFMVRGALEVVSRRTCSTWSVSLY
jgi:MFS family permease